jgi:hypothetical protein
VKETQQQMTLPGVPKAKQGREVHPQWEWTEEVVWTERMLATLEGGIKGGKWLWPNAFFAELGLISLTLTRAQAADART